MNNFSDVIGHKEIIKHMQSAIQLNKISHAYIIEGLEGVGKKTLANAFVKALQCEGKGINPCNQCSSCRAVDSNNHPDVIYVTTSRKKGIGVDDIREQLNTDIYVKPYMDQRKIYIIDQADSMTEQAQNAMLKTIEEPPEYGIIILLAENAKSFLDTILSRCIVINAKPVAENMVKEFLICKHELSQDDAAAYAAFSRGSIGLALDLYHSESFNDMREDIIEAMELMIENREYELLEMASKMAEYKGEYKTFFDLFLTWLRDLLVIKKMNDEKRLIHRDKYKILLKQGELLSYNRICKLIDKINETRAIQKVNVNFLLSLEMMLIN